MARARNIKPGFYANEDLAECSIWARFIFPGLWMLADREGRLEYRPKRIKGLILPFDTVDVEPLLHELEQFGFIASYVVDSVRYLQIVKFLDHQNPHHKEAASAIPAPDAKPKSPGPDSGSKTSKPEALPPCIDEESEASLGQALDSDAVEGGVNRADSLIPDSGFSDSLIPESPFAIVGGGGKPREADFAKTVLAAAQISMALIDWERQRQKAPRGILPSNQQIIELAGMRITGAELTSAYADAVADRAAANDPEPVNAGFIKTFIDKHRRPPKPKRVFDDWHKTDAGTDKKARELGMTARGGETYQALRERMWTEIRKREGGKAA